LDARQEQNAGPEDSRSCHLGSLFYAAPKARNATDSPCPVCGKKQLPRGL
jgi:hypothetical protein